MMAALCALLACLSGTHALAQPGRAAGSGAVPGIAAASDLQFALEDVAAGFTRDTGRSVAISYGSSGNFFRQIAQGAPFEMFLSADEDFILQLAAQGHAEDEGALYAIGHIVLFAPHGSPLDVTEGLDGLRTALEAGGIRRFAIANPEHAPYGRAAEQALRGAGLWTLAEPRLVLGENVSQAAQFAISGSADGGIFALSLALNPAVAGRGEYVILPEDAHAPLRQRMALMNGAGETARAFYDYVRAPPGRAILARHGFPLSGESR
jgi:molybdate transport system substrate-binding protein